MRENFQDRDAFAQGAVREFFLQNIAIGSPAEDVATLNPERNQQNRNLEKRKKKPKAQRVKNNFY